MFDWTGTLVDEYDMDRNVCKNMELEISKKERITLEEAKRKYLGMLNKYENLWEWYNYPLHGKIFGIDWKKAQISELQNLRIIPKAIDVVSYYKEGGYYICLVTNAAKEVLDLRMDYLKMRSLFDLIVTSDDVKSSKTTGKHFEYAMKLIDTKGKDVYVIGDSLSQDILPATKFKFITIQCKLGDTAYLHTNNNKTSSLDVSPDYIITRIDELLEIIK